MEYYNPLLFQQLAPSLRINDSDIEASDSLQLRSNFNQFNIARSHWDNCIIKNRILNTKYIINFTNSWNLECEINKNKKFNPAGSVSAKSAAAADAGTSELGSQEPEAHSILSPFNPQSDLYPNGILSETWFKKYIELLPFAFVGAFKLSSNAEDDEPFIDRLISLKLTYSSYNIKFIAIIVSRSENIDGDNQRIDFIRQETGLPKLHGLYYINTSKSVNANISRDFAVLVSTLLSNLKASASDFYSSIELRIKQHHKKYYSFLLESLQVETNVKLTPAFLMTRNLIKQGIILQFSHPQNVELTIKHLTSAYDSLLFIVADNFNNYQRNESKLKHDINLYNQYRTLLDTVAFHIVRSYLAIEDPITALVKHKDHITRVLEILGEDSELPVWISVQYEWLAELVQLVPNSIQPIPKKFNNNKLALFYFGGIEIDKNGERSEIITKLGLLYLKAAEYLKNSSLESNHLYSILPSYLSVEQVSKKRISLFKMSRAYFMEVDPNCSSNMTSSSIFANRSFVKYIDWLIAEEHFALQEYQEALNYFVSNFDRNNSLQQQRALECYRKLEDGENYLTTAISIANSKIGFYIPTVKSSNVPISIDEIDIQDSNLVSVDALIVKSNFESDALIFDECIVQLEIKSLVDVGRLSTLLGKSVAIKLNRLDVKFNAVFKDVLLVSDSKGANKRLNITQLNSDVQTGTFGFSDIDMDSLRIIQFSRIAEKVGRGKIEFIDIKGSLLVDEKSIQFCEKHTFDVKESNKFHSMALFLPNGNARHIRLNGLPGYNIVVSPVKPEINLSIEKDNLPKSVIVGEKLKLPFQLNIAEQRGVDASKLSIVSYAHIEGDDESINEQYTIRTNWEDLKDDVPLTAKLGSSLVYLNLSVLSPPSVKSKGNRLLLEFKVILNDNDLIAGSDENEDEYPTVFNLSEYQFEVLQEPFALKYGISPFLRDLTKFDDMPSPFVLNKTSNTTMPITTRAWTGKVTIQSIPMIEIVSSELSIKSQNPEVHLEEIEGEDQLVKQFTTTSKTGFSHRNVILSTTASIKWKRNNSSIINEIKSTEWEVTLPLADPRVLLKVTGHKEDELQQDITQLRYYIENPTPRIFTFSTQFVENNWELVDELNAVPVTQSGFPVLPFLRHEIDFHVKGKETSAEPVKLPELRVYDVNYKVWLPTLVVSNNGIDAERVYNANGTIFIRR